MERTMEVPFISLEQNHLSRAEAAIYPAQSEDAVYVGSLRVSGDSPDKTVISCIVNKNAVLARHAVSLTFWFVHV